MKFLQTALLTFCCCWALAQSTMSLTLQQADSLFLSNNLLLLAGQYNLNTKEALVIQARAYPNPTFTADVNAYDPENDRIFHIDKTGQKFLAVEQLILLGGKRKTEINIAKQNKKLATLELEDLLRNLRYQLHTGFYIINQQRITLAKFNRQLEVLDTLISAYEKQAARGNLPLKDVIRLKAVYFKINNDKSELANNYFLQQHNLQLLLQTPNYIEPLVGDTDFDNFTNRTAIYNSLLDSAFQNRPDLKLANEEEALALLHVKLQKQLAVPDMAFNSSYDQRSGAFVNQVNVGVSIPLPLWNRNRGNVKAAQYEALGAATYQKQKLNEVQAQVLAAWQDLTLSISEYQKLKAFYSSDFDIVFNGVNQNFQKGNISILEFVDFFESYNESLSEYERVKNYLATSAMQINYVTASKIY
ncbi:MAG: TolC family protein [Cyclobacteriaceae bacterium]|nr:TolC family protein [Cyclobacteriaceae bacterium]